MGLAYASSEVATVAWETAAACRSAAAPLFISPTLAEPRDDRTVRVAQAKAVCATCEVRPECLAYALRVREPLGIWGGMDEAERRAILADAE